MKKYIFDDLFLSKLIDYVSYEQRFKFFKLKKL